VKSDPYEEGRIAAAQGISYRDGCPYSFGRAGVSQDVFDREFRPLMDQWFDGWKSWLHENGLGFNFKPKRCTGTPDGGKAR
jgi:hypothetical protein